MQSAPSFVGHFSSLDELLAAPEPDLIHIQHEFGLFGTKVPGLNRFPATLRALRSKFPRAKIIATAHSVIAPDFRYPLTGRGWEIPLRALANLGIPVLRRAWGPGTWGLVDGVVVHSELQRAWLAEQCPGPVSVVPHFVPLLTTQEAGAKARAPGMQTHLLVFGYFTPEKGQDLVLKALPLLPPEVRVTFAGGLRRGRDRRYFEKCLRLQQRHSTRAEILGFVPSEQLDSIFETADLVVAPFRDTSGSGSLAQALAHHKPILASDHPLNRELVAREANALALFRSGDPESLAAEVKRLLSERDGLEQLRRGASRYSERHSATETWQQHLAFYQHILGNTL